MRIISGKLKSRRLSAPKNLPVRPTTDMAKESLFNILNNNYFFDSISVIDLFSGTGNISYEFSSRGTKTICAVDAHYGCIKYINETAKALDLDINTFKSDVYKFLEKTALKADIIRSRGHCSLKSASNSTKEMPIECHKAAQNKSAYTFLFMVDAFRTLRTCITTGTNHKEKPTVV